MTKNHKPTHRAYIVRNYPAKDGANRSQWTDVGSVWPHADGKGFDVALIALPVDGRLSIRLDQLLAATQAKPETEPVA